MKSRFLLAVLASVLVASPSPAQESKKPPKFAEVVAERFTAWDKDHDGALSPAEIDAACVDPAIKGPQAAAVATLKRIVRSDKYELPPLTMDYLIKARSGARSPIKDKDADREDSTERDVAPAAKAPVPAPAPHARPSPASTEAKSTSTPDWAGRYQSALTRIEKTDRALFSGGADATIERCHQGPLGDCFFVSVVGAVVKRNPAALRAMIHERPQSDGGGYAVEFPIGRTVNVSPITDAEIVISSTTGDGGLWLAVLEKAFGMTRIEAAPTKYTMESATDAIAKGGNTSQSIRTLTGHAAETIALKRKARSPLAPQQYDANRQLLPAPATAPTLMEPVQSPAKLAKIVREKVPAALQAGRIVAAGTGEETHPPGINPKHAYAVLGYDAAADKLILWNPHGNTFPPRNREIKEPGLASGYPTKSGVFEVPVDDFVRIFRGVTIETERATATGARKG
jgi:hypothetical protein